MSPREHPFTRDFHLYSRPDKGIALGVSEIPEPVVVRTAWCGRCKKKSRVLEIPNHKPPWMRCCGTAA